MARKTRVLMIISILIFVAIVFFVYVAVYNKPHVDVYKSSPGISLTSDIIVEDFENNETLANSKYLEQIIQVTGTISEVVITKDKGVIVLNASNALGNVMCHVSASEHQKINALKKGQEITMKGICTGYLMDVILVKCVIVEF